MVGIRTNLAFTKSVANQYIKIHGRNNITLNRYSDANWARDANSRRLRIGYIFFIRVRAIF